MCGIAGFTQFHQRIGGEDLLCTMGQAIQHRGPDASGVFLDDNVGLCHRRLSIIDLSPSANQPFIDEQNDLIIVFNGEIYNFKSLRESLRQQGYHFKSSSDTEVILAAYHFYGTDCVSHLNGMFAFAIWDKAKKTLFVARDRMGKKPFYYALINGDLVFASELKSLLSAGLIQKTIRPDALQDYFFYQYVPEPKTIFENVFKLEPAHCFLYSEKGMEKWSYWDVDFSAVQDYKYAEANEKLIELIQKSTQDRMISDVPIGAFLSGGVDSSGIVACMANASDKPIKTCSIGFDEKRFNETEFAAIVATHYQTDHHQYNASNHVEKTLLDAVGFFDEPFADPSFVPTYLVCELARQQVTVALAGDGGDEIFAGYEKYHNDSKEQRLRSAVPKVLRQHFFPGMAKGLQAISFNPFQRAANLLNSVTASPEQGFFITNAQIRQQDWQSVVSGSLASTLTNYDSAQITTDIYRSSNAEDHLGKILYTDLKTYLPGNILVKADRMSMAHSLEVRAPLLDYRIVEFAATLPSQFKYHKGDKKHILKSVFSPLLPDEIIHRKKMGFSPPLAAWMRKDLKPLFERVVLQVDSGVAQIFELQKVKKIWEAHLSGRLDKAQFLWSMLVYELWWRRYIAEDKAFASDVLA